MWVLVPALLTTGCVTLKRIHPLSGLACLWGSCLPAQTPLIPGGATQRERSRRGAVLQRRVSRQRRLQAGRKPISGAGGSPGRVHAVCFFPRNLGPMGTSLK